MRSPVSDNQRLKSLAENQIGPNRQQAVERGYDQRGQDGISQARQA